MLTPRFTLADGAFVPDPSSRAPWSADMLHGRLIGGLAARAIEADLVDTGLQIARLTVDLFRPAGMVPVTVTTETIRRGKRIQVIDAIVHSDGHEVARVTGLALAPSATPPGNIWQPEASDWPDPLTLPVQEGGPDDGWEFRGVEGGFATGDRSRVWTNETRALVDDEPLSPVVRAAVSGDLACPLANSSDDGLHYINADYTLTMGRLPVGDWIGIEVSQQIAADGISLASCTYVDADGPFGMSTGSSITTTPMR